MQELKVQNINKTHTNNSNKNELIYCHIKWEEREVWREKFEESKSNEMNYCGNKRNHKVIKS